MPSANPFSVRLSGTLDAAITEEARRTKRSKGAVLESLAEEALRTRRFPGVAFRGDDWDRRAWVMGSAFDVWEVIQGIEDFGSAETVVEESALSEAQVALAQAYYRVYGNEIDEMVRENRRSIEELTEAHPTFRLHTGPSAGRP
ncbi:MAG: hypothetical protein ACREQM_02260 [Candidatus Dormibacteraceae bacterium]